MDQQKKWSGTNLHPINNGPNFSSVSQTYRKRLNKIISATTQKDTTPCNELHKQVILNKKKVILQ